MTYERSYDRDTADTAEVVRTTDGSMTEYYHSLITLLVEIVDEYHTYTSISRFSTVISIYSIETMLGSRFIFNNGNTQNGLIFDPKGGSDPPKTSTVTPTDGLS